MCPDLSSSDSNPADNEPIPNERNEYYLKYFVDEFENLGDLMTVYVRYRIAGGRMKFKESDTGTDRALLCPVPRARAQRDRRLV